MSTQVKRMRFSKVGKCDLWENMQQGQGVKELAARKVKWKCSDVSRLGRSSQFWKKLKDAKKC